jgi:hypothetical protein
VDLLAELLRETGRQRLDRMRRNADKLADRGFLHAEVRPDVAADVMWTCTSPELYDLLVLRRGWTPDRFGAFVATLLEAALLAPTPTKPRA